MQRKTHVRASKAHLEAIAKNKPIRVFWKVIVPKEAILSPLQTYDVLFDDFDYKIRQLTPPERKKEDVNRNIF